ncbi:hypothetical protein OF83DRAFT_313879 [Amylostereum chailletii]|nr:hypothetical protein OF83DRAFT_313879 [Amylostereum chailletii]
MEKGGDDLFFVAAGEAAREGADMIDKKDSGSAYSHDGQAVDGFITPTELEMETLRHVPDKLDWSAFLIAFVEMAERFSFYGSTTVFVNFISSPRASSTGAGGPNGQSGALGQGQQTATGLTTLNQFWSYVTPLLGAYLADTYWGRFKTIAISIAITLVGHILLVVCSLPPVLDNPQGSLGILSLAIVVMGLGTGGFKSNISPLVAEQQRNLKPFISETKQGERVVVDPILTTSRIYMYFYFFINVGSLIGQITMTFAEKASPTISLTLLWFLTVFT